MNTTKALETSPHIEMATSDVFVLLVPLWRSPAGSCEAQMTAAVQTRVLSLRSSQTGCRWSSESPYPATGFVICVCECVRNGGGDGKNWALTDSMSMH